MATLLPQKIIDFGTSVSTTAATSGGDEFLNTGLEFLYIQNDHSSASYNITVIAQVTNIHHQQFGTVVKENVVKAVAAGTKAFIGPFKQSAFNDSNNKVQVIYSAVTDLKVGTFYLDQQ